MESGLLHSRGSLVSRLRTLQEPLRARGVISLHLFGSRSRGDHHDQSDVDVLIGIDRDRRFSALDLAFVSRIASDRLGLRVNPVIAPDASDQFISRVSDDLVEIFTDEGNPH